MKHLSVEVRRIMTQAGARDETTGRRANSPHQKNGRQPCAEAPFRFERGRAQRLASFASANCTGLRGFHFEQGRAQRLAFSPPR